MTTTTHSARVTGPLPYAKSDGKTGNVPIGPCLIEQIDDRLVDIIWGAHGQSSAALPVEDVKAAAHVGNLVVLD